MRYFEYLTFVYYTYSSDLSNIDACNILNTFKEIIGMYPKGMFMIYNNATSHIYCSETF